MNKLLACIYFSEKVATYPRLTKLLQNEFQHNLIVFEDERTIFIYNVGENTVRQTMFVLELAGIRAGYGVGKNKKESLNRAIHYLQKHQSETCRQ